MLLRNIRAKSQPFVTKIILDTHGGLEDVIAILHSIKFAKYNKMEIIGITVTNGRRSLEDATTDALLAVYLSGKSIPIYKGTSQGMMLNQKYPKCINYSEDNSILDQLKKDIPQDWKKLIQTQHAAKFLAERSKNNHKQLGIVCFGPLTNIGLASHLGKEIRSIGLLSIAGGQHSATGNVIGKHSQEGNFSYDPESAFLVLKTFRKNAVQTNLYITPIQTTLTFDFKKATQQFLSQYNDKLRPEIKKLHIEWLNVKREYALNSSLITSIILFYPRSLKKFYEVYAQVCIQGRQIKGLLAIDWLRMQVNNGQRPQNVRLAYELDQSSVQMAILQAWQKQDKHVQQKRHIEQTKATTLSTQVDSSSSQQKVSQVQKQE